jgi:hypothetical protein
MDLYIHSPIRLRGIVLNYLSTGATLPLPYPLNKRLGGSKSRSECCGEEKNIFPCGESNPSVQPVAVPTELTRHMHWRRLDWISSENYGNCRQENCCCYPMIYRNVSTFIAFQVAEDNVL